MSDSIAGTVTAILCVVVGLLIIGTALVPIVEHASVTETETTVTEEVTGYNTPTNSSKLILTEAVTLADDGTTTTYNGEAFERSGLVNIRNSPGGTVFANIQSTHRIVVSANFTGASSVTLTSGTITLSEGVLTIAGTGSNGDYSGTKDVERVWITDEVNNVQVADEELYYIMSTPVIIGEDQFMTNGLETVSITTETAELPDGMTKALNDNGTATFSFTSGVWYAPYQWTGYTETTETVTAASEYAPLYAIIPIMLILSMAYVLIRRF